MLDGYGLHQLTWNLADQVISDILVASPMDAEGRGIALSVRQDGAAADLDRATAYLVWTHRVTGKRGTTEFEAVDASVGAFEMYYPAAMCEADGVVDASVMLSLGDGRYISTRGFLIRVEKVLVDGLEPEDGFTLFVQAIAAYESAADISTEAAEAANAAAEAVTVAMERGDFDGADGEDGFSPVATVTQTGSGATITITDANGTTTASIANGAKGDKGETGAQGPKGDTGERGPQGIQGEVGPKGDKGETGATGAQGPKGETGATGATGPQGPQGIQGETGATGPQGPQGIQGETGPKGEIGAAGADGSDGVSCTHSWNGTVLSVTSASGTSSADLVGPQGPTGATGATGPQGPAGADGTTFTPQSPLSLSNGVLSVDLSDYAEESDLAGVFGSGINVLEVGENNTQTFSGYYSGYQVGEVLYSTRSDRLCQVTAIDEAQHKVTAKGVVELARLRGLIETTLDVAPGQTGSGYTKVGGHALVAGTLLLNVTSGNLMRVTADVTRPSTTNGTMNVQVLGVGNVYGGGASYTANSPLDITNDVISIDLSGYAALAGAAFTGAVSGITPTADAHFATKKYVDDAIAALDDLSEVSF